MAPAAYWCEFFLMSAPQNASRYHSTEYPLAHSEAVSLFMCVEGPCLKTPVFRVVWPRSEEEFRTRSFPELIPPMALRGILGQVISLAWPNYQAP